MQEYGYDRHEDTLASELAVVVWVLHSPQREPWHPLLFEVVGLVSPRKVRTLSYGLAQMEAEQCCAVGLEAVDLLVEAAASVELEEAEAVRTGFAEAAAAVRKHWIVAEVAACMDLVQLVADHTDRLGLATAGFPAQARICLMVRHSMSRAAVGMERSHGALGARREQVESSQCPLTAEKERTLGLQTTMDVPGRPASLQSEDSSHVVVPHLLSAAEAMAQCAAARLGVVR